MTKNFREVLYRKALNKSFAPEFINRVDEIITFDQLSLEAITKIIDIELKGLYDRIKSIGYKLVIEDKAKEFIASKGYDVQYGARPLKRNSNLSGGWFIRAHHFLVFKRGRYYSSNP